MGETNKDIETKTVTKLLEFKLEEHDYVEKGKEAAMVAKDIGDLEREFKAARDEQKSRLGKRENELQAILQTIRQGTELREVECVEEKDFVSNKVSYIFQGEVKHERPLELHERQAEMKVFSEQEPPPRRRRRDTRQEAAGEKTEDENIMDVIRMERSKNKPDLTA